ncbi:cytochrome c oxidase subunit 7C, mitochondrial-like [Ursus americanus]|uniref:Cytochrome c oxidase subunit 7C, mitochondrial n=2 Tax=Ursus TaxID=9639 RepID=A0A452T0R3_URSMA|nr:cytochrome c oxidase subunit 7C, mitochondrial-like [Ursus arctos]XP_045639993.1 cytochrome c oxidase subunit 7C, mitochondrial-like [Ursus americanus]
MESIIWKTDLGSRIWIKIGNTFTVFCLCAFHRTSNSAVLGQSIRRVTASVVCGRHCEVGPRKNLPFSVENKWWLLIMMTLYFGSGFVAPFFIVRYELLKK